MARCSPAYSGEGRGEVATDDGEQYAQTYISNERFIAAQLLLSPLLFFEFIANTR